MKYLNTYESIFSIFGKKYFNYNEIENDLLNGNLGDILIRLKDEFNIKIGNSKDFLALNITAKKYLHDNYYGVYLSEIKDDIEFAINYICNTYNCYLKSIRISDMFDTYVFPNKNTFDTSKYDTHRVGAIRMEFSDTEVDSVEYRKVIIRKPVMK